LVSRGFSGGGELRAEGDLAAADLGGDFSGKQVLPGARSRDGPDGFELATNFSVAGFSPAGFSKVGCLGCGLLSTGLSRAGLLTDFPSAGGGSSGKSARRSPGTATRRPHLGHCTLRPARSSGTIRFRPHSQANLMGMRYFATGSSQITFFSLIPSTSPVKRRALDAAPRSGHSLGFFESLSSSRAAQRQQAFDHGR
jgi:hypothetical protein